MMMPSASGVSSTRSSPNLSSSPSVTLKTPPERPISSPRMKTRSSRSISCERASLIASSMLIVRAICDSIPLCRMNYVMRTPLCELRPDMVRKLGRIGIGALLGELHRLVDFLRNLGGDLRLLRVVQKFLFNELLLECSHRIFFLPR